MLRSFLRVCSTAALLWMAWSRSASAECYQGSYCEWHPMTLDYCNVDGQSGDSKCVMSESHECETKSGQCGTVN